MELANRLFEDVQNRFRDEIKFLKEWVSNPASIGSVAPTSQWAAKAMVEVLPIESGLPVLELGPGTGSLTKQILNRGLSPEKLFSVEFNEDFIDYLEEQFPDVNFVHGNAFELDATLDNDDLKFCGAVSGLPLLNFPKEDRLKLITQTLGRIEGNGPFIQMCYGPNPPVQSIAGEFTAEKHKLIIRNIPPLHVWIYRKEIN